MDHKPRGHQVLFNHIIKQEGLKNLQEKEKGIMILKKDFWILKNLSLSPDTYHYQIIVIHLQ